MSKQLSKRDMGIIAANPDMSAMELHQVGGLSKAGFDIIVAMEAAGENWKDSGAAPTAPKQARSGPVRLTPNASGMPAPANQPILQPLVQDAKNTVKVRATDGVGNGVHLNPRIAARMKRMYPNQFK